MTDYTVITDSQVDPDAPITSGLGYAWRDNLLAVIEGDPSAPKIDAKAFPGFAGKCDHNNTTRQTVLLPQPSQRLRIAIFTIAGGVGAATTLRMYASSNAGVSFGAPSTLVVATATGNILSNIGELEIDLVTGSFTLGFTQSIGGAASVARITGTLAVTAGTDAIAFDFTGSTGSPQGRHTVYYVGVA